MSHRAKPSDRSLILANIGLILANIRPVVANIGEYWLILGSIAGRVLRQKMFPLGNTLKGRACAQAAVVSAWSINCTKASGNEAKNIRDGVRSGY